MYIKTYTGPFTANQTITCPTPPNSKITNIKIGIERPHATSITHTSKITFTNIVSTILDEPNAELIFNDSFMPTSWAIIPHGVVEIDDFSTWILTVIGYNFEHADDDLPVTGECITSNLDRQHVIEYLDGTRIWRYGNDFICYIGNYTGFYPTQYDLIYTYTYNENISSDRRVITTTLDESTASISFSGLSRKPLCWYLINQTTFDPNYNIRYILAVVNDGQKICGVTKIENIAEYSESDWTEDYDHGTLTITSNNPETGGNFYAPGTYLLMYVLENDYEHEEQLNMYKFTINGKEYYINENDILEFDNLSEKTITITPAADSGDEYTILTIGYEVEE